ncbi:MAG: tetratricopeptide repeat protein [Elusimicrobiales bacterium]|nr:tetratricopeptide repeat protein [Elusimicrobiales bacterium]
MTQKQIIYLSILFELGSISSILIGKNFIYVILFFLFHIIASLLISTILIQLIPKRYTYSKIFTLSFFTLINSITFFIGYLISFYFVFVILRKIKIKQNYKLNILSLPSTIDYPKIKRNLGEGAYFEIDISSSVTLKSKVIDKLSTENSKTSISLLKKYINDPDYEIRMFAFQKIYTIKNIIFSQIKELLRELEKNPNDFYILKKIAILYWEIYNLGLSDDALKNFYLSQINFYISKAQDIAGDGELLFIQANLMKELKNYDEALKLLEKSLLYGANPHDVLLIVAEIYYHKNEYEKVRETLSKDPSLNYDTNTSKFIEIWLTT